MRTLRYLFVAALLTVSAFSGASWARLSSALHFDHPQSSSAIPAAQQTHAPGHGLPGEWGQPSAQVVLVAGTTGPDSLQSLDFLPAIATRTGSPRARLAAETPANRPHDPAHLHAFVLLI
jgi:hypothetical protein